MGKSYLKRALKWWKPPCRTWNLCNSVWSGSEHCCFERVVFKLFFFLSFPFLFTYIHIFTSFNILLKLLRAYTSPPRTWDGISNESMNEVRFSREREGSGARIRRKNVGHLVRKVSSSDLLLLLPVIFYVHTFSKLISAPHRMTGSKSYICTIRST